jgi:hypothetical protein
MRSAHEPWSSGSLRSFWLYRMPPASLRGLQSDAPSRRQIIVQPRAIFKRHLSRSAFVSHVAEHFDLRDTRTVKPCARFLFLALLRHARLS